MTGPIISREAIKRAITPATVQPPQPDTLAEFSIEGSTLRNMTLDEWVDCLPKPHQAREALANIRARCRDHDLMEAKWTISKQRIKLLEAALADGGGGGPVAVAAKKRARELRERLDKALDERDQAIELREAFNEGGLEIIQRMERLISEVMEG